MQKKSEIQRITASSFSGSCRSAAPWSASGFLANHGAAPRRVTRQNRRCHSLDFVNYFLTVFALYAFCVPNTVFGGEIEYAKVLDMAGTAEVLMPPRREWVPVGKNTFLEKGTRIRTRTGGHVWIAFDSELDTIAELGENSYLSLWTHPPSRLSLKEGRLGVFREINLPRESVSPSMGSLKVLTKEMMVEAKEGGFILEVSKKGSLVKVFADSLTVFPFSKSVRASYPKKISEGFKFFRKSFSAESFYERMRFPDYTPWKVWIEKVYELKDDWAADRVGKELGL